MVAWRTIRGLLLLCLLIIGVIGAALYLDSDIRATDIVANFSATPTPQPEGIVDGARTIEPPVMNPVLQIHIPERSLFAPVLATDNSYFRLM